MEVGRYRITTLNHGFFRLDGGAMFGSVPKALWSKRCPPDEENRILLATRSLQIDDGQRKMIVDVGCGDKWNEKTRSIFCIDDTRYVPVEGVTDVLLTHLHFDHAGGVSRLDGDPARVLPNYPAARHYVSRANYEIACSPNTRERASYLAENVDVLRDVDLKLLEAGDEPWPGVVVHRSDGHTSGLHWITVSEGRVTVAFPADLIPTSNHLPVPFVMGYDMCAETSMREKSAFLDQAIRESWVVVFEHDPSVEAARLALDDRGRPVLAETFDMSTGLST
jgi:glyoxylase-like metal-dependent hydrolase (beta-lactamase superfamily II)